MRWPFRLLKSALALLLLLYPAWAGADIIVLTNGNFLKVESYEIVGDQVIVQLEVGGTVTLRLRSVERFVEDELGSPVDPYDAPDLDLGFSEDQAVPGTEYGVMIYEVARKYDVNARLVASVTAAESDFDSWARSEKGAMGLMQVMPATAERFGADPNDLFDPLTNLDIGVKYLSVLRERFEDDVTLILAAYNAGEATVDRFGGVPPYRETQQYIRRVFRFYGNGPG